jgi:hypothetical protein
MDRLIKKIDNLQPEHFLVESYENEPTFEDGWNRAICAVDDLINSEVHWKDLPDEEGWWWFSCSGVLFHVCLFFMNDILTWITGFDFHNVNEKQWQKGKWQKSLMPKGMSD